MSRLIGLPGESWTLARAVDALGEAAQRAGIPGAVWIAGLTYPSLWLAPAGVEQAVPVPGVSLPPVARFLSAENPLIGFVTWLPLMLIGFRLTGGLALLATPEVWDHARGARRTPRLREAWRRGKGLLVPALGLWLTLVFLLAAAAVTLVLPVLLVTGALRGEPLARWPGIVLLGPVVALFTGYFLVLSLLYQLSLHSLVHNRRGVASALIHAWRLVRHEPWAAVRAVVVDFVLFAAVHSFGWLLMAAGGPGAWLLVAPLVGFQGVTRAGYWARNYRAFGGLAPPDGVPGLEASTA